MSSQQIRYAIKIIVQTGGLPTAEARYNGVTYKVQNIPADVREVIIEVPA